MPRRFCFALLLCGAAALAAAPPDANLSQGKKALAQLPLRFEANQGQWTPGVRYAARAGNYDLLLKQNGPSLAFAGAKPVDISLVHSNPKPEIEGLEQQGARTNYFIGKRSDWHTDVPNYSRVRYRGVYPGVDMVYYGNQNQLEYDFVLQPGADPRAIRMKFSGAKGLRITPEGDLVFETAGGRMVQKKPVIYQQDEATGARTEVTGRYAMLSRNEAGVRVDHYDRTRQLVIDPFLVYSTYIGGIGLDEVTGVQYSNGSLYVTGYTVTGGATDFSGDLVATSNAYKANTAGLTDAFLAVINTTQAGNYQLTYLSYLGGTNVDQANAVAVDGQGNAYLTGTTTSTNFPVNGSAMQTSGAATQIAAFVTQMIPSQSGANSLGYSTYLGGTTGNSSGNAIAVDKTGKIYVVGTTSTGDFPVTGSAYAGVLYGSSDAFITEIDVNSSTPVYSTYLGGEKDDDGRGVALGPNGRIYFAASSNGLLFPLAGNSNKATNQGGYDVVIGVLDPSQSGVNSLLYTSYLGGSANDMVRGMAVDPSGNILVTGYTLSTNFPVTSDAAQVSYGGNADAFVTVVNPSNPKFIVYSTYLGGSDGEVAYAITSDSAGFIYVTGYTMSADFPITANAPVGTFGEGIDVFVTKLQPGVAGPPALQYSTYFGNATINSGLALATGPNGLLFVGGYTEGSFNIAGNATQGTFGGGLYDGFVLVVSNTTNPYSDASAPAMPASGATAKRKGATGGR